MPTSFTDLERGKGLSAAAALGTTAASLPSTPLLARVCWGKAVPPCLAVPVGLECPSLWEGRGGTGGHGSPCRADGSGAHLTSAMAKSPTFSILKHN